MGDEDVRKSGHSSRNNYSVSMAISLAEASSMFPSFQFSPTNEELIQYYLKKKIEGSHDGVEVIPELKEMDENLPFDLEDIVNKDLSKTVRKLVEETAAVESDSFTNCQMLSAVPSEKQSIIEPNKAAELNTMRISENNESQSKHQEILLCDKLA